jgi:hypothetical protein
MFLKLLGLQEKVPKTLAVLVNPKFKAVPEMRRTGDL